MVTHYKDDSSNIDDWMYYTFNLLFFLNPEEVGDCFVEDLMFECPENEKLRKFCDYLTNNYIFNKNVFMSKIWTAKFSELIRTTNTFESFHSFFSNFYCCLLLSSPIGTWLDVIQEIQNDVYIKLNSIHVQHGKVRDRKDRKKIERQLKNEDITQKYNRGQLTRYEFIKYMAFNYYTIQ